MPEFLSRVHLYLLCFLLVFLQWFALPHRETTVAVCDMPFKYLGALLHCSMCGGQVFCDSEAK